MSSLALAFKLTGAGWARLEVNDGTCLRAIEAISYLSTALDDLIRMGIEIATDRSVAFAQFFHEPGSTVLVAETGWWNDGGWEQGARLSAFQYKEYGEDEPTWRVINETERDWIIPVGSRDELARALLVMGQEVIETLGTEGYLEQWVDGPFPLRALKALEAALEIPSLPGARSEE